MLSMNFNVPLQMERKWYWLSGNSPNVNWTQHVCIGREGKLWQILLTGIWQCRADTVWFGFYYYRRSVVRAVFHRRWQIVGKVLELNNVFCHCSAFRTWSFTQGSHYHLLFVVAKKQATKTILYNFKYDQRSWVPEYGKISSVDNC